ncbi:ead/Ea22-like family protein [Salmonella sp. NW805]|uniref:ead/Ea22-like family protein n=1 Tax=unclassified Salmonella TaxID=2614656 RepID=UPI003F439310
MTALNKQALRERYSSQPVPKCHICGAEMTIQRISASRITYGCTGATYDDAGYHYAEGRSIADYHYEQSRVTVVDVSDPDVLALLDELDAAEKLATQQGNIAVALLDEVTTLRRNADDKAPELRAQLIDADNELETLRQRIAELEANPPKPHHNGLMQISNELVQARQRIAELESRTVTVKLPELCVGVVQDGHAVMVPYAAGHWFNKTAILEMLAAAGIGVKGE